MKIMYYKVVDEWKVKEELLRRMEFTAYQKSNLSEVLRSLPYRFVQFDRTNKPNVLVRLTAPLYFVSACLLVAFMPIKWLFTGAGYYKHDSPLMKKFSAWYRSLSL